MIKTPKTWKELGPVRVDPSWQEYFLSFDNDLERLTALHIFRQQSIIGYLLMETFQVSINNMNPANTVTLENDYDKGMHYSCAAENEKKVAQSFKAFASELQTTGNLSTGRARQIMQSIKNPVALKLTSSFTPTPVKRGT